MFSKTHGETQDNFAFHRLGDKLTTAWGKVAHAKQRNRDGLNNRLGCFLGNIPLCDRVLSGTTLGQISILLLAIINQLNLHEGRLKNFLVEMALGIVLVVHGQ